MRHDPGPINRGHQAASSHATPEGDSSSVPPDELGTPGSERKFDTRPTTNRSPHATAPPNISSAIAASVWGLNREARLRSTVMRSPTAIRSERGRGAHNPAAKCPRIRALALRLRSPAPRRLSASGRDHRTWFGQKVHIADSRVPLFSARPDQGSTWIELSRCRARDG